MDKLDITETLGGWVAIAALRRPLAKGLESLVVDACVAFRLIKQTDTSLLLKFDLRTARSLKQAYELLQAQETSAQTAGTPQNKLLGRLRPIRALLDAANRNRDPIERSAQDRSTGVRDAPDSAAPPGFDCLIDESDTGFPPGPLDEPSSTTQADTPQTERHMMRQTRGYDDCLRDQARTRIAAASSAMRDLALPASVDLLTDHEARTLLAAARAAPQDAALTALALSLIYGRSVERLCVAFEADPISLQVQGDKMFFPEAWFNGPRDALALEIAADLPKFAVELPKKLSSGITSDGRERLRLGVPAPLQADLLRARSRGPGSSAGLVAGCATVVPIQPSSAL